MINRIKDKAAVKSQYFLLPSQDANSNESQREYTERISKNIHIQIDIQAKSILLPGNQLSNEEQKNKISDIARDLIIFTNELPHTLALYILFDMVNHPRFMDTPARDILLAQIQLENMHRSPLNTEPCTLETILKFYESDRQDVEEFLANPARLIIWMNKASALEISRLIRHFYFEKSPYFTKLKALAKSEHNNKKPAKAFLCYALISPSTLNDGEIREFAEAANNLNAEEKNEVVNLLPSIKVRAIPTQEYIKKANNRFIHCHLLELSVCNFSNIVAEGALLNHAKIDGSCFNGALMTEAQLHAASLTKCDFTNASLVDINLSAANLTDGIFIQANLSGANLSGANLTNTNFFRANLRMVNFTNANLDNVNFFDTRVFSYKSTLTDELTRLADMLRGHTFEDSLHQAVLNSFLKYTQELAIPAAAIARILELAYTHPLFSAHRHYDAPIAIANYVSKGVELAVARFWYKQPVTDIKVANETPAQQTIYQEWLARTSNKSRPPQPAFSPDPPK